MREAKAQRESWALCEGRVAEGTWFGLSIWCRREKWGAQPQNEKLSGFAGLHE